MADSYNYKVKGAYINPESREYLPLLRGIDPKVKYPVVGHGTFVPVDKFITRDNYISGRRADLGVKPAAKDRMETSDTGYDRETMRNLLNAYKEAAAMHGLKMLSPDDLLTMALVEGRSNFGYNDYNVNNKRAFNIAESLKEKGHDRYAAGFPAAIVDKQMAAERLKVPFYQVWNGAGPKAREYNQRIEQSRYAVEDPRNQNLRNFIRESMGQKPIGKVSEADIPDTEYPTIVAADTPLEAPLEAPIEIRKGGMVKMPQSN
jgi:hypothetical protein